MKSHLENGQGLVEYALILVLVAVVGIVLLSLANPIVERDTQRQEGVASVTFVDASICLSPPQGYEVEPLLQVADGRILWKITSESGRSSWYLHPIEECQ